jgi:tRNA A-37 threonylcarbamoyl transferase component Bud32
VETQASFGRCRGCGTAHEPGSPDCPLSRIGATIDARYKILRLLGIGGMGAVYEAENVQLARRVALKVLHPEMAKRLDIVERFRREARAVANLRHHGFAQVYALDTDERGQFFIEMELLEGAGVDRLIHDGPIPIDRCAHIITGALEALSVAHAAGLVHRDLKPENLFVCNSGHIKLLDFGIAHADDDLSNTATGQFIGTAAYASPEQLRDVARVDARSDIYSLGATAYEIVTRQRVCGAGSFAELTSRTLTGDISRSVCAVRPDAPAWMDAIIQCALATDPARRFNNAAAMLNAMRSPGNTWQPASTTQPNAASSLAHASTFAAPSVAPARSKLPIAIVGAGVIVAAVIGIVVATRHEPAAAPARDAAIVATVVAADAAPVVADAPAPIVADAAPVIAHTVDAGVRAHRPVAAPPPANESAEELNEDGKKAMYASPPDYAGAAKSFEAATRVDPKPKYFFNLCTARFLVGEYGAAKAACTGARAHNPDASLDSKLGQMLDKIADQTRRSE